MYIRRVDSRIAKRSPQAILLITCVMMSRWFGSSWLAQMSRALGSMRTRLSHPSAR